MLLLENCSKPTKWFRVFFCNDLTHLLCLKKTVSNDILRFNVIVYDINEDVLDKGKLKLSV